MLRLASGLPSSPAKVTVTCSGDLPVTSAFFCAGDVEKLVYCPKETETRVRSALGDVATVIALGEQVTMPAVADDLAERGVRRLMVEGGGQVHTQFLIENLVDELQRVIALFFVGESRARRASWAPAAFRGPPPRRAELAETRRIGDVVLLRYALSDRFDAAGRGPEPAGRVHANP